MLLGVVLHSSSWQEPRVLFDAITLVSHSFRMGAFFALSGFLAAVALQRRSPRLWLQRRLARLGVPAVFGLLVLCPLTGWVLSHRPPHASWGPPLPYDWYHLWFLVALLLYTPVFCLLDGWQRRSGALDRAVSLLGRPPELSRTLLLIGLASFALMLLAMSLVKAALPIAYFQSFSELRNVLGYLPVALFGFTLARSEALGRASENWRVPMVFVGVTAATYVVWFLLVSPLVPPDARNILSHLIALGGAAFCPPAAFLLLFGAALRVRAVPAVLKTVADASFTIYLLHVPVIAAINIGFARVAWDPYFEFAITVVLSSSLTLAFHQLAVRRSPLLALLLNGVPLPRSVDETRHHVAVAAADLDLRAGAEDQEALAIGMGLHLLDEVEIDDGGAVHPLKPAGI
ncbi:hypothetical protein DVW87_11435 [Sphingomonas aracearum]|uniref:Acyltransferase 3 domain-containing protein n=1 Tax=Sphingomonas aracearum TaxID=2283317 RepID=A0A369W143_9SPHN|nr:hypothetical protein DVW87_11435 [Sphingomonas aracearum]